MWSVHVITVLLHNLFCDQQVHWSFISSAFSFSNSLHQQNPPEAKFGYLKQATRSCSSFIIYFDTFIFIYLFFLNPTLGICAWCRPVWSPPSFPERVYSEELARRCGPFSRFLSIASAWFPSSSCWLCRQFRSVPTETGRTRDLLRYFLLIQSDRAASWFLIGRIALWNAPGDVADQSHIGGATQSAWPFFWPRIKAGRYHYRSAISA